MPNPGLAPGVARKSRSHVSSLCLLVRGLGTGLIEQTIARTWTGRTIMTSHTVTNVIPREQSCSTATRVTKSLLGYGVVAGAVFEAAVLVQGLTRHGFSIAHDDASLLGNGPLGWIQIAAFLVSGLATIAFAVGARRALAGRAGGTWGPRLIGIYGAGLMAAGMLRADPADGFGPGAPAGRAVHISWHAAGHLVSASIGFLALIAACLVFARYFSSQWQRGLAWYSRITGLIFLAGFAGVASGSSSIAVVLPFYAAVLAAFTWMAVVAVHVYRRAGQTSSL